MVWWKEYILSVLGCILFFVIISQIVQDLRYKKLIHIVCSLFLTIVILKPLTSVELYDTVKFDPVKFSPAVYLDTGKQAARNAQEECIKEACESYIASKANEFGLEITSEVFLNEDLIPYFAQINSCDSLEAKSRLEELLEEDLGITKENQVWIWNQEKGSS